MKTLSVTIICKNEEQNLIRILPKLNFANEIVVVDTGSADGSVKAALQYTDKVYYYRWQNDFAKARNYAISKAKCDYVMWLDCDDDLPENTVTAVKAWLADGKMNQDFVYLKYRMGADSQFWFWRERIIRNTDKCRFKGFIHEAVVPFGSTYRLDCDVIHTSAADHSSRNLDIYCAAISNKRRFSVRDKYYYARTLIENGLDEQAIPILHKVSRSSKAYVADRVSCTKLLARQYLKIQDYRAVLKYLSYSVTLLPPDAEICCLFGDAYYLRKNYLYAAYWYELALNCRVSLGFVNDYFKSLYPYIQLSVCYFRQGDFKRAKLFHKLAKNCSPDNPVVQSNDKWF